jgi:hypothetical protein
MLGKVFNKAKELGSKGLHEAQRKTAIDVLNKTQNKVSGKSKDVLDKARVLVVNKYKNGGGFGNNRMYNFLKEDLVGLEEAIKEMPFSKEEIERFFSYWGTHLKSLKTKTNDRMYNFLEDDLEKLKKAINDDNIEEIDKFFSYWNQHIESLKMKNGGGVGFRNIDKIKSNIGETVFNHINSLNKSQLEKQLSELKSELKSESKNTERHNKLKDEEWYILYRLERSSEFKYAKGSTVKGNSNYKKFGKDNSRLVNFDIDDLDSFESFQYDQLSNSMDKADALQILINNTESDYSQLNEQLAEIAEEQYPSDEFFEDNREYKNGGSTKGFNYSIGGL